MRKAVPLEMTDIIDYSGAGTCNYQLTDYCYKREHIQFALDQLGDKPWKLRKHKKSGKMAVYTNISNLNLQKEY